MKNFIKKYFWNSLVSIQVYKIPDAGYFPEYKKIASSPKSKQ